MAYKINFKDSNCQYVEDYNAGKYNTIVKIYFCEGDGCCPKQYSGSVGTEMITADTIEELKLKLDRAVANRDKEIAKTLTDSKKEIKDADYTIDDYLNDLASDSVANNNILNNYDDFKAICNQEGFKNISQADFLLYKKMCKKLKNKDIKDADYTKQEVIDAVMEAYGFNKKEANEWYKNASEGSKKAIVEGFKQNAKKSFYNDSIKDSYDNLDTKTIKEATAYLNKIAKNNYMPIGDILKMFKGSFPNLTVDNVKEMYESVMGERLNSSIIKKAGFRDSKVKDGDSYGEWDYEINCEGNQWADGGFDSEEEAEDEAIAKVNELLEDFPEDYAVDDFDITIMNTETGESYLYDPYTDIRDSKKKSKDCNFATLTPGNVKLKRDSKKFNQRDAKFCDASADDIIDLFHEAYIKGRTWDWLKNKLPSTFLNLKNKKWEEIFPIQADRTGKLKGVNLTRPKQLSEEYVEKIDNFTEAFEEYMRQVEHLEDYGLRIDTYDYSTLQEDIQKEIDTTDSKKRSEELEQVSKQLRVSFKKAEDKSYRIPNISLWREAQTYADLLNKGSYDEFKKYIANEINEGYRNRDYKENQKKPIIYNREGSFIRSDSKVGPLTPEAEAYIRKVMGETTTEEIESKRKIREGRRDYDWYTGPGGIKEFSRELYDIKQLLRDLKSEQAKEKKMDISVRNRQHGYYKYTGNGNYDWNGNYRRNGGYEYTPETKPTSVDIDMDGLGDLKYVLAKVLNSGTVAEIEENLQEALEVAKKLPRNNPKVAEIKAKIKALLEKRANAPVKKLPLPDKKYRDSAKRLRDGLSSKELAEYIELCKKLKLDTFADIQKFSRDHDNAEGKALLEALRKEVKNK